MEYQAKYVAFWPGRDVYCCERHLEGLRKIGAAMGISLSYATVEDGDEQCSNCLNEAKKAGPTPEARDV